MHEDLRRAGWNQGNVERRLSAAGDPGSACTQLAPCTERRSHGRPGWTTAPRSQARAFAELRANAAQDQVATSSPRVSTIEPWQGDFNRTGLTRERHLRGLPQGRDRAARGITLITVTGYDHYDRNIDIDLDFSPETLFQIMTDDDGCQFTRTQARGRTRRRTPVSWDIGGWVLPEELSVECQERSRQVHRVRGRGARLHAGL